MQLQCFTEWQLVTHLPAHFDSSCWQRSVRLKLLLLKAPGNILTALPPHPKRKKQAHCYNLLKYHLLLHIFVEKYSFKLFSMTLGQCKTASPIHPSQKWVPLVYYLLEVPAASFPFLPPMTGHLKKLLSALGERPCPRQALLAAAHLYMVPSAVREPCIKYFTLSGVGSVLMAEQRVSFISELHTHKH